MKILLVDDDPDILDSVSVALRFQWRDITVLTAGSGAEGLRQFYDNAPDFVVLDVNIPDPGGFEVLSEIRRVSDVPIIMLTALQSEISQVRGLELGADDYVSKPFGVLALLARIRNLQRRREHFPSIGVQAGTTIGELTVDFDNQQVWVKGRLVPLTPAEYRLFYQLVRNVRRVIPSHVLRQRVWGAGWEATPNDLKALVSRLRTKLGDDPRNPRFVETHRGVGYRLIAQAASRSEMSTHDNDEAQRAVDRGQCL